MPPKKAAEQLHHVSFHFGKSAVLLSVQSATTLSSVKSELVKALKAFETGPDLARIPKSANDIRLYEDNPSEGAPDRIREVEGDEDSVLGFNVAALGWPRWKRIYVSFKNGSGDFPSPSFTIPEDEDEPSQT